MDVAWKILLGAALGAAGGLVAGRARVCSAEACRSRPNLIFSVIAGAVFGAAVAWYLIHR
jgi:7-keto-8-aminopelargonate synthetase-like enzyme